MEQNDKEKRVKKEISRLNKIFKDIPKDKLDTVQRLIENAGFMAITLQDLADTVNREGATQKYQNGENQWGFKRSAEADLYIAMMKQYQTAVNKLLELLPKTDVDFDDGFDDFLALRHG